MGRMTAIELHRDRVMDGAAPERPGGLFLVSVVLVWEEDGDMVPPLSQQ